MDKYGVIGKAHKALMQALTDGERLAFAELTPEHQRYLISWGVRSEDNCPDDMLVDDWVQQDIDGCIENIKDSINHLTNTPAGLEQWEQWLGLKRRVRPVMEANELINLLFDPMEIRATGGRRGIHDTARFTLAGFLLNEGYIEPYRYPWQTTMKNIIFKEYGLPLPNVSGWTRRDREMYFAELPNELKAYAQMHIDDMEAGARRLPQGGYMHPLKMVAVWQSYLQPATTCSPQAKQPQAIPQPREAKYSATESEDKRRREIYSEVERTHAAGAKKEMLIEEAATKARCSKRTMRRAVFGK